MLDGSVNLAGNAVLGFATGLITTLTATARLVIDGAKAFFASGDTTSNSALRGLTSNAGYISLDDGAFVQLNGGLNNTGFLAVDYDPYALTHGQERGGATLKIGGTLTNTAATSLINIGSDTLVAPTLVEATALNSTQRIDIAGSAQNLAELRIDSAAGFGAAGVLHGDVELSGRALLDFKTGQITTLASDSFLTIAGAGAFVADVNNEARNSALDGLTSIAGVLALTGGASVAATGSLAVTGSGDIDLESGGSLSVQGSLSNGSAIIVGARADTVGSTLTAGNMSNTGVIAVNSDDALFNTSASIGGGLSKMVVNALTGKGTVELFANASLVVGAGGDNAVVFSGANALLKLGAPAAGYTGAISGFKQGDTLDLAKEVVSIQSYDGSKLVVIAPGGATQTFALSGPPVGSLAARSDGAGGTAIAIRDPLSHGDDFNGDGAADILWRNASTGQTETWFTKASGGYAYQDDGSPSAAWKIVAKGDLNGDGYSDILWRNTSSGDAYVYLTNKSGGFGYEDLGVTPLSWSVAGVGDFDGDGAADILWQNTNGAVELWQTKATGGFTYKDLGAVPGWSVSAIGDLNGDGLADVLWRNGSTGQTEAWTGNGSGGFNYVNDGAPSLAWQIAGIGQFGGASAGDGDLLWRNSQTGDAYLYLSNGAGGFNYQDLGIVSTSWQIAGVGDYGGASQSGILWRNSQTGSDELWQSKPGGGFAYSDIGSVPTSWSIF